MNRKAWFVLGILLTVTVLLALGCAAESLDEKAAGLAAERYSAGLELHDQGLLEEAIAEYSAAVRLNPDATVAYYNRGVAYQDQLQFQLAIEDYTQKTTPRRSV